MPAKKNHLTVNERGESFPVLTCPNLKYIFSEIFWTGMQPVYIKHLDTECILPGDGIVLFGLGDCSLLNALLERLDGKGEIVVLEPFIEIIKL